MRSLIAAAAFAVSVAGAHAQAASGSTTVRDGGIGQTEQQRFKQLAPEYGLALTFTDPRGRYLAGVDVRVVDDAGGEVVSLDNAGPMVLVDLEPGRYRVHADYDGQVRERSVRVPNDGHRALALRWPTEGSSR